MAHVISFRCPSLIIRRTGLPYESTMAWILVLAPPRLLPISVGGPLFLHQHCADAPGQWNHPWKVPPAQHQGSGHRRYYPGCHPLFICGSGCKQSPMGHNALAGRAMEHHCERSTPFR